MFLFWIVSGLLSTTEGWGFHGSPKSHSSPSTVRPHGVAYCSHILTYNLCVSFQSCTTKCVGTLEMHLLASLAGICARRALLKAATHPEDVRTCVSGDSWRSTFALVWVTEFVETSSQLWVQSFCCLKGRQGQLRSTILTSDANVRPNLSREVSQGKAFSPGPWPFTLSNCLCSISRWAETREKGTGALSISTPWALCGHTPPISRLKRIGKSNLHSSARCFPLFPALGNRREQAGTTKGFRLRHAHLQSADWQIYIFDCHIVLLMQVLITLWCNGAFGKIHLSKATGFIFTRPSPTGITGSPNKQSRLKTHLSRHTWTHKKEL